VDGLIPEAAPSLASKLRNKDGAVALALLKDIESGSSFLAASAHICSETQCLDVKTAQVLMATRAVAGFGILNRAPGCDDPLLVTLGGDFSSKPPQQGGWSGCRASSKAMPPSSGGAYALLSEGRLEPSNPEHPAQAGDGCEGMGAFCSPLQLRSAYKELQGAEPEVTARDPAYASCLDYIWVGYLEGGDVPLPAITQVLEMPYDQDYGATFGPIPNKTWPSDHLSLGCTFQLQAGSHEFVEVPLFVL